jgi:hypothetical protein
MRDYEMGAADYWTGRSQVAELTYHMANPDHTMDRIVKAAIRAPNLFRSMLLAT